MMIMHPTDFSLEADAAEKEAARLARRLGGALLLLHVSVEAPLFSESAFGMADVKRIYDEQARWAERQLDDRAAALTKTACPRDGGVASVSWTKRSVTRPARKRPTTS